MADTWTFRRVLHAFLVQQNERMLPFALLAESVFGKASQKPGAAPRAPGRAQRSGGIYDWYKPRRRYSNMTVVHVEDDLSAVALAPRVAVPLGAGERSGPPGITVERHFAR